MNKQTNLRTDRRNQVATRFVFTVGDAGNIEIPSNG